MWPELTADEVLAATHAKWDLSGPLPVPAGGWLACPVCRDGRPQPRYWRWHRRAGKPTVPWRCDVSFKCVDCAAVWTHGIAVDEQYYRSNATKPGRMITWREVRDVLDEHAKAVGASWRAEPTGAGEGDASDDRPPAEPDL